MPEIDIFTFLIAVQEIAHVTEFQNNGNQVKIIRKILSKFHGHVMRRQTLENKYMS